jgi:hypothetical protein
VDEWQVIARIFGVVAFENEMSCMSSRAINIACARAMMARQISRAVHPLVMCKLRVVIPAGFWLEPFVSSETLVCICSSQKLRSTMPLLFNALNVLDVSTRSTPMEHQLDSLISHILSCPFSSVEVP